MNNHLNHWQLLSTCIKKQLPAILLYVVQSRGSSPGRTGFFMIVNAGGQLAGSIGGGIMEHKFVELAKARLVENIAACSIHRQVHNKSAANNQSGMICSGEQIIAMYTVQKNDLYAVNEIIECLESNRNGFVHLSPAGIDFFYAAEIEQPGFIEEKGSWHFSHRIGFNNKLYIIGGGHCALALSQVMSSMNFYIVLIDDRQNLNTIAENKYVHEKKLVSNYAETRELISTGKNVFVVVMTMGYRTDDIVIRSLHGLQFKYLGVLGSKSKMKKMFTDYLEEGMDKHWLHAIRAPAGLNIKSQTPEEIAISIAGEIIQEKNAAIS